MLRVVKLSVVIQIVVMLSVTECLWVKFCYSVMLNVTILSTIILSIILSVIVPLHHRKCYYSESGFSECHGNVGIPWEFGNHA